MARVSVVLTSCDHEKFIREAIESSLRQTYSDFELIIWDDASNDDSWAIIKGYSDPRIRAFRNDERRRGIYGLNNAISEVAVGEYIAIHHSDDVWEPEKLEKQVAFLDDHPEIGAVFCKALAISEDGSALTDEKHFYFDIFDQPNRSRHEWLRFFFRTGNALCHPSALIRRSCYADCGLYRYGFACVGDLDMWMRLCLKYEIHVLQEKLVRFRVRDNEANASGDRPETRARAAYEQYRLLLNYREITRFDDLVKIFPAAAKYDRREETDLGFALGMIALREESYTFSRLFGLDLLFDAILDPARAARIERLYDFDYRSFVALTGSDDVLSHEGVGDVIGRIYGSRSWRLMRPLRKLARLARRLKGDRSAARR